MSLITQVRRLHRRIRLPLALGLAIGMGAVTSAAAQHAYVAHSGSDSVSVIDTSTRAVVGTPISVGSSPQATAVSPNGAFAYVANNGSHTVSVIDTATRAVVDTINVGSRPSHIAITPAPAPSPAAVPTLSERAMILLALMLAGSAMIVIQTRCTA
jgi:YVTN family beta-propeller protein